MSRAPSPVLPRRLLKVAEAAGYIGLGETKFRELLADGIVPKPREIEDSISRWDIRDLDAYIDDLPYRGQSRKDQRLPRAV
ncbi:MAG: hypothetical protein AAF583_01435 [Pseudomonadota bacterium]